MVHYSWHKYHWGRCQAILEQKALEEKNLAVYHDSRLTGADRCPGWNSRVAEEKLSDFWRSSSGSRSKCDISLKYSVDSDCSLHQSNWLSQNPENNCQAEKEQVETWDRSALWTSYPKSHQRINISESRDEGRTDDCELRADESRGRSRYSSSDSLTSNFSKWARGKPLRS